MIDRAQAAKHMNTSIIGPAVTLEDVRDFVLKARVYPLAGLAVEAHFQEFTRRLLESTPIHLVGVANYPLGGATLEYTLEMTRWCYGHGADEMDVNVPIGLLRSGQEDTVRRYLEELVEIASGRVLKGVIWSDEMDDEEIVRTCELMADCGVTYVKTNPGFGHVTSAHIVPLIKNALGDRLKVMVAGGVRTTQQMLTLFELGADIVTTSALFSVLKDLPELMPEPAAAN
jgi:deoxyribose-phosphate aldolase